jgi:hypothetical protein
VTGDDVLGLLVAVPLLGLFLVALLFPERF